MARKILVLALLGLVCYSSGTAQQLAWQRVGELQRGIGFFEVAMLSTSRVLVMGGRGPSPQAFDACTIIDVERRSITPAAPMSIGRVVFASTIMPNGRVYVFGGYQDYPVNGVAVIECYDPINDRWENVGELTQGRAQLCVTPVNDEEILIVGGRIGVNTVVATCEIYNITTKNTRRIADYPYITSFAKVMRTRDGRLLGCSGREGGPGSARYPDVFEYLPSTNQWVRAGAMKHNVYYPSLMTTATGDEWLIGGSWKEYNSGSDAYARTIMRRRGGNFDSVGSMLEVRCGAGVAQLDRKRAVIVGGLNNNKNAMSSCEFLDLETGSVETGPSTIAPHSFFRALSVTSRGRPAVLAISGAADGVSASPLVEILTSQECVDVQPDSTSLAFAGAARRASQGVDLTPSRIYQQGAVWYREKLPVADGFSTYFSVQLSEGTDSNQQDGNDPGADGFALVLQNESLSAVGGAGQGIGYSGIRGRLAVEFDAYKNASFFDPNGSHLSIQKPVYGVLTGSHTPDYEVAHAVDIPPLVADGTVYHCWVEYDGAILTVWMSTDGRKGAPRLTVPMNLGSAPGWLGITSATGFARQAHTIRSWTIRSCGDSLLSSVQQQSERHDLRLTPTPASTSVSITIPDSWSATDCTISLLTLEGRTVHTITLPAGITGAEMMVNDLPSGMYGVRVLCGGEVVFRLLPIVR